MDLEQSARIAVMVVVGLFGAACAMPPPEPVFRAEETPAGLAESGLRRIDDSGFRVAWLRPNVVFSDYTRIELIDGGLAYRDKPLSSPHAPAGRANYALPEAVTTDFVASLRKQFAAATARVAAGLSANEPSARVLVVRIALVDVEIDAPLDYFSGNDSMYIDSLGAFSVTIDLFDAPSREHLAHFAERSAIAPVSPRPIRVRVGDAMYEVNRICSQWAQQFERLLVVLRRRPVTA
jgi:hypothetical protein